MARVRPSPLRETDLYGPVRDWLAAQGYAVRAEVEHSDVIAKKGEDLIVIELKRRFDVSLLIQAARRQRISDSVYVALPKPASKDRGRRWRGIQRLIRQLEMGLIVVSPDPPAPRVEILFHPLPFQRRKLRRARRAVLEEMANRSGDYNQGGSVRKKLVTAYRENAIQIACCLQEFGPLAPRQLRALGTGPKTLSILSSNFYGWFERVERGIYALTAQGKTELEAYPELVSRSRRELDQRKPGAGEEQGAGLGHSRTEKGA